jgi:hypothetical protein
MDDAGATRAGNGEDSACSGVRQNLICPSEAVRHHQVAVDSTSTHVASPEPRARLQLSGLRLLLVVGLSGDQGQLCASDRYTWPRAFGVPSLFMSWALGIGPALNQA